MLDVAPPGAWVEVAPRPLCRSLGATSRQQPQRTLSSPAFDRGVPSTSLRSPLSYLDADKFPVLDTCSPLTGDRPSSASSTGQRSKQAWNPSSLLPERSDRSMERLRDERVRPSSASSTCRRSKNTGVATSAVRENSRDRNLRPSLQHGKRPPHKQDDFVSSHEQSRQDLVDRLRLVTSQLQEETRARKEQEIVAKKLARDLQEAHVQLALLVECEDHCDHPDVGSSCSTTQNSAPTIRPQFSSSEQGSSATTLRLEHERLREKERDQRRRRRLAQPRQMALDDVEDYQQVSTFSNEAALALEEALAQAQAARARELEAHEVARVAIDENKALRYELEVFRSEFEAASQCGDQRKFKQQAELRVSPVSADTRLQNLTKVVNEIAQQADLRQLQQLAYQATDFFESEAV